MPTPRAYVLRSQHQAPQLAIDYARELNPEQREVVEAPPGPVLCIAGAGSGKTRTLTYRVARLIELGFAPESILLLTFTNKAAREMLGRVAGLCRQLVDPRRLTGGTFHHAAWGLLREHAAALGTSRLSLLDREDSCELMTSCIAEQGLAAGLRRFPRPEAVVETISTAINTQTSIPEVLAQQRPQFLPLADDVVRVAGRFIQRKASLGLVDFDDLLLHWKRLMLDHPPVRAELQRRFRAVLVDEYQDTNKLQGEIIDLLAGEHRNVTAVGDDAQSIYGFRGALLTNIVEFPVRYPGARVCKLTRNYRSSPEILALANASIAHNRRQFQKELTSVRPPGPAPVVVPLRNVFQQAEFVAQRILELRDEGTPLREIGVLYRAHQHGMEIQLELSRRGIPFAVRSGLRFVEGAHIKDVLAHLRFAANGSDELAFKRMVKLCRGIGSAVAERLWTALEGFTHEPAAAAVARARLVDLCPPKASDDFESLLRLLDHLEAMPAAATPADRVSAVLDLWYRQVLEHRDLEDADRRTHEVEQLAAFASQYPDLPTFLGEIALLSEFAAEEVDGRVQPDEKVVLSSVHQAKGLEWRAVFVVWLVDGRFPMLPVNRRPEDEEEERRLFYVAATRAKDELHLTFPLTAEPRDRERLLMRASRFIEELPAGDDAPYQRLQIAVEEPAAIDAAPGPTAILEGTAPPRALVDEPEAS